MFNVVSEETYQDGQVIFKEGSAGNWLYTILSGSVEIYKMIEGKKFTLGIFGPGEIFGEMEYFGGFNRTATAQAVGETTIGLIDRDSIDQEFNKMSSDFRSIIVTQSKRLKNMNDRVLEYTCRAEPRFQKTISLSYRDRQSFIKAYTANISKGGLFIKTENPLKQGDKFLLKITLPGLSESLEINCVVAWVRKKKGDEYNRPPGMGIKFEEMTEKNKQIILQYIKTPH